jgi:hypothetical protein
MFVFQYVMVHFWLSMKQGHVPRLWPGATEKAGFHAQD